ncbi:MAG: DNA recombination protein RmuC, partial [Pseudomonadota bacterium]
MTDLGSLALDDPRLWLAVGGLVLLLLLIATLRATQRAARLSAPLAQQIAALNQGQQQLAGGLTHVSEA